MPRDYVRKPRSENQRIKKIEGTPSDEAKAVLQEEIDRVTMKLLDAAMGRHGFANMKPESRLTAILKVMEYALGKPNTGQSISGPEPEKKPEAGIEFV